MKQLLHSVVHDSSLLSARSNLNACVLEFRGLWKVRFVFCGRLSLKEFPFDFKKIDFKIHFYRVWNEFFKLIIKSFQHNDSIPLVEILNPFSFIYFSIYSFEGEELHFCVEKPIYENKNFNFGKKKFFPERLDWSLKIVFD